MRAAKPATVAKVSAYRFGFESRPWHCLTRWLVSLARFQPASVKSRALTAVFCFLTEEYRSYMDVFLKNLATALASLDPGKGVGTGLPLFGGDSASNPKCMPANLHLARRHGRLADDRL